MNAGNTGDIMGTGNTGIIFQKEEHGLRVSESTLRVSPDMKTRHYHETAELFVLEEGERFFFVDRYVYHMKPMSAVLIPPGQIHKTCAVEKSPEHRRFLLQYSGEDFDGIIRSSFGVGYNDFCLQYNGLVSFRREAWEEFLSAYRRLKNEFEKEEYFLPLVRQMAGEILALYVRELLYVRGTEENGSEHPVESGIYRSVHKVTAYLNDHYREDLTLDDLAEKFFISRSYLTRIFKETTGITVVQYLTVVRIRQAARLLRETDSPITEIADLCGFGNVTYFEKVFHRIRGMTPRQYRMNNRGT